MALEARTKVDEVPTGWWGRIKSQWSEMRSQFYVELETQQIAFRLVQEIKQGKGDIFLRHEDADRGNFFTQVAAKSPELVARANGVIFEPFQLREEVKVRKMGLQEWGDKVEEIYPAPVVLPFNEQAWRIYRRIQNWLLAEVEEGGIELRYKEDANGKVVVKTPLQTILETHMRPGDRGSELMKSVEERLREQQAYFVFNA